jgi:hypothetical protein
MNFQRIWLLLLVVGLIVIASRKAFQGEAATAPAPAPAVPSLAPTVQAQ